MLQEPRGLRRRDRPRARSSAAARPRRLRRPPRAAAAGRLDRPGPPDDPRARRRRAAPRAPRHRAARRAARASSASICAYLAAYDPADDAAQARGYFAADGLIIEDPATGSAAGPLCAYLHARTGAPGVDDRAGRGDGPAEPPACARRASACASPATSSCSPRARSSSSATAKARAGAPGARSWRRRRARGVLGPPWQAEAIRAPPVPQHKTRCLCRRSVDRGPPDLHDPDPVAGRKAERDGR